MAVWGKGFVHQKNGIGAEVQEPIHGACRFRIVNQETAHDNIHGRKVNFFIRPLTSRTKSSVSMLTVLFVTGHGFF